MASTSPARARMARCSRACSAPSRLRRSASSEPGPLDGGGRAVGHQLQQPEVARHWNRCFLPVPTWTTPMTWPPTSSGAATSDDHPLAHERARPGGLGHVVDDHGLGPLGHLTDHALARPRGPPVGRVGEPVRGPHGQALTVVGHQEDGGRRRPPTTRHVRASSSSSRASRGRKDRAGVGDRLDGPQGPGGVAAAPAGSGARPPAGTPG